MTKEYLRVWNMCLAQIKQAVPPQSFTTWFEPIKPIKLEGDVLTILVPNKFFYEWLEEHYVGILKQTIFLALGPKGRLEYQIKILKQEHPIMLSDDEGVDSMLKKDEFKNAFVIPGIIKHKFETNLNPKYTLDNFIEGDCNRLARNAGLAIAERPGTTSFNPLFIYGDVGLGKTHIANGIGNAILAKHPTKKVLFTASEKFTQQLINSIKQNNIDDFIQYYMAVDVLIIDDIQFLANKGKTLEIFFHIFNQLHQNRKQIVMTCDKAPKDLVGMEDRLISRFKWGLTADLQAPDLETRIAILESKMNEENLEFSNQVKEYVAYNIKNNIRELEGVLISLVAHASINKKSIDINLAREVIQQFVANVHTDISVENILQMVAEYFDIDLKKMQGNTRKREVVVARQLSMYLAKAYTKTSLKMIGNHFGGKDHSTVIYSCRAVQDLIDTDAKFKTAVESLERRLKLGMQAN